MAVFYSSQIASQATSNNRVHFVDLGCTPLVDRSDLHLYLEAWFFEIKVFR